MKLVPKYCATLTQLISTDVTDIRMMEPLKLLNPDEHMHFPK